MIKVDEKIVEINKFPDGTPRINLDVDELGTYFPNGIKIDWKYENDGEMFYLMLIKRHLEGHLPSDIDVELFLPYVPNARMDRTKNADEVFTLKYFCDFINSLGFSNVYVLDPHSDVSVALLNGCVVLTPEKYIRDVFHSMEATNNVVLYFPDSSAAKRYSELFPNIPYCYGEKKRDWKTGKILGLDVRTNGIDLSGKTILMIDDIVSYGGSLFYSAEELKKYNPYKIYAYATHTENSVLDKEKGTLIKALENNTVERLFTTNSLFTGEHEKITVMEVLGE